MFFYLRYSFKTNKGATVFTSVHCNNTTFRVTLGNLLVLPVCQHLSLTSKAGNSHISRNPASEEIPLQDVSQQSSRGTTMLLPHWLRPPQTHIFHFCSDRCVCHCCGLSGGLSAHPVISKTFCEQTKRNKHSVKRNTNKPTWTNFLHWRKKISVCF